MNRTIAVDERSLPLIIRRTGRKRSIGIELTCRHEVVVRAPRTLSDKDIHEGLSRSLPWLRKRLSALPPVPAAPLLGPGSELPFLGEVKRLAVEQGGHPGQRACVRGDELAVALPPLPEAGREAAIRAALVAFYRVAARRMIAGLVERYSAILGVSPPFFSITGARRRWGSCGANGRLNFAWRLIMAPPELIEYVVVHELCHLKRRDHSPAFWVLVAAVLPDYRDRRRRLHEQGILCDL
ncbi:MAG: SprT family zinc-dependent metalloprotease [Thermodesulfobacteriota bacterium]